LGDLLQPGEASLEACKRLERQMKSAKGKALEELKTKFDRVVELASLLVDNGEYEAHFSTKEQIQDLLDDSTTGNKGANGKPSGAATAALDLFAEEAPAPTQPLASTAQSHEDQWQYKWSEEEGVEVYGPYPTSAIEGWLASGFFSSSNLVLVRSVQANGSVGDWRPISAVAPFKPYFSSASLY